MTRSTFLFLDALVNLTLGLLLIIFPPALVEWLGIPEATSEFYPNLLGAVLFGIGIALLLERYGVSRGIRGLGLAGAVSINLIGALVLAGWLIFGSMSLPVRGYVFLWIIVAILVVISLVEILVDLKNRKEAYKG
jgi:hypothetical protein